MLLVILMLPGNILALTTAIILVLVLLLFLFFKSKKKRIKEPEPEKEFLFANPGDYIQTWDDCLYVNLLNPKVKIRTLKLFGKTENKDKLIFASSLAFNFSADDKKSLSLVAPQITGVEIINSHELLIVKSQASHFYEFNDAILKHLFIHLNRKYDWMNKKVTVISRIVDKKEGFGLKTQYLLNLQLSVRTSDHLQLGVLLGDISEINNRQQIIAIMSESGVQSFNLETDEPYTAEVWKKILPKIKEACTSYFIGGIDFIEY